MSNTSWFDGEDYEELDCFQVMSVSVQHRCQFARSVHDCNEVMNFFKYFELMYCIMNIRSKVIEVSLILFYILIVLALMVTIIYVVDFCFAPMLKILSIKLRMNEYLAGVTLLAFGNSLPDLVANMLPVREKAPLYTITLSNSLAVILISGGTVIYLKPFTMDGHTTVRDLLFLALAGEIFSYIVMQGNRITMTEALYYSLLYIIFVIIVVLDMILTRLTIKALRIKISDMMEEKVPSIETRLEIRNLQRNLRQLERDDKISIRKQFGSIRSPGRRRSSSFSEKMNFGFATRKPDEEIINVDYRATRRILHSSNNARNKFLFSEFLESLLPINLEEWHDAGIMGRVCLILRAPLVFFCIIFIPVVNYHLDKHGWSKLLNCTQIITCPIVMVALAHGIFSETYTGWIIQLDFSYSLWTLCVTVPLAIIVFFTTRTDLPPPYHLCFLILTAVSSMVIITICAAEMEILCAIIGAVLYMSEGFVAATLRSIAAGIADMLVNTSLAMQGYERMAFAAILGSPLCNMILGVSIPCIFNKNAHQKGASYWIYGEHGSNCYIFFTLAIVTTLWWTLTFNFFARRSAAIFSFLLFILFLLFALLVELDLIHEFSSDRIYEPE